MNTMPQCITALLVCLQVFATPVARAEPIEADVLLRGGTIYDGAGGEPLVGDVAIHDQKIVAVGKFETSQVGLTIDCTGKLVCPGFVDLHNHSDRQVVKRETRSVVNFLMQGCTTIVTGNCGAGPVDVAEYIRKMEAAGVGVNVAHLLPQGSLREEVLGSALREPSADELKEMLQLADKAMRDGAWGMSTGLIYVPSSYAQTDELISIAKVVAKHDGIYASHIRNENVKVLAAVDEAMRIGREAGCPVHISHFKSSGREAWGLVREAARQIEKARQAGEVVTADQYPYIASSTSLGATLIPTWARAGGDKELLKRLEDKTQGERIRTAMAATLKNRDDGAAIQIARFRKRPEWAGLRLAEIAKRENKTALETALYITQNGGASIVNFSMNEDDVRHIMRIPWVATASDGRAYVPGADKPHPRNYGTFPRKLGYYAMKENVLPLAQAVRSMTGLPAKILRMKDRGFLKPGQAADVVVLNPKELRDRATFAEPHQYCSGVVYVFVNGGMAVSKGTPTGARYGKPLKHAAP